MIHRCFRLAAACLALLAPLAAQSGRPAPVNPYDLRGLTKEPGPNEPRFVLDPTRAYPEVPALRANPVAPRMIAEWEKVQGALIRYPLGISVDAVKSIASELKVYVLCSSASQSAARSAFQSAGVNMANVAFITATTDTYWARDYAPWWITTQENGQRVVRLVDVIYRPNGERPNDDRVPQVVASYFQQPSYFNLSFVCQGGNVMTDGLKGASSTDRLRDENPSYGESELKAMASTTVGFSPYYLVTDPAYPKDYIKHIDCWAKFISPTKVLVKRVPASDSYYYNYEAAADLWRGRTNGSGQPYTVIRIDGPSAAPYVNHVILNDRVFVPILNSETDPTDKAALDQIRAAYGPGYRVIGVKAAAGLPWLGTDSIHCRVNSIPVFTGLSDQDPEGVPVITSHPASVSTTVGKAATFTVTASGATGYQWKKNGVSISGATAATYTTPAVTTADNGASFTVTASNASGSVTSNPALLTVTSSPALAISTQPASQNVAAGSSVSFTVGATGGTAPYTYQWYKNGTAVSGATSATYTFTAAATDNGSTFSATVTDSASPKATVTSSSASLTVSTVPPPTEKILNGGFESGATSWSGTTGAIGTWSGQPAYAGTQNAWLGGNGKTTTETLYQSVTIPSTATSATLSFYLHIDTAETTTSTAYDKLVVSLQNASGSTLKTLATYSNLNKATGYQLRSFDVSAYNGQTVRVYFKVTEDSLYQTSFVLDNLSLIAR